MIIRNGIKSVLRERGRTVLFSLLIVFLTITMILSISVLLYCSAVMEACDEAYRSIALIEYMGSEYPNEDEPDPFAREAYAALSDESILAVPGVTAWTRGSTAAASAEGYERRLGVLPYSNWGVIIIDNISEPVYQWERDEYGRPIENENAFFYYTCTLKTSVYSKNGKEGIFIDLLTDLSGFQPEQGKSYILNGSFVITSGSSRKIGNYPMNGLSIFRVESFAHSDELPYAEYHEGDEIPEVFLLAAEQYRSMNNYVHVVPCRDVNDVYVFHQSDLMLAEGVMPDPGTPGECVVSADLARSLGLKPGDEFSLDELRGTENDRYDLTATGKKLTYKVSGIANASLDYCGMVWVIAEDADTPLFGYSLGTASLINDEAEAAVEALRALVPEQVRVSLLDQGYASAVQPFREVKDTALNVLLICSAGVAAVLLLFAFLFVGRQSDTVKIMVSLGTPGRKITLWFLSGAALICGGSAILGTLLGTLLRPLVFRIIAAVASAAWEGATALRYSETTVGVVKQTFFEPHVPLWPNLPAALGIVLLAMLFCLLFLRMARRSGTRKRGKSRVRVPHGRTSVRGRGGLRFALTSIRRGGLRSLVVPLVSLVLTLTVLILGGVYQGWQNELDEVLDTTQIDGMVVSLNGRYYSGLSLTLNVLKSLLEADGLEDISVSCGYNYWLPEEMPDFGRNGFGYEHRMDWIASQPELVALNSLSAAKEFYYSEPSVTWLEGWDESMLSETELTPLLMRRRGSDEDELVPVVFGNEIVPAVCGKDFMEEHGLALGDTIHCMVQYGINTEYFVELPVVLKTVGSYVQRDGKAQIFAPLSLHAPISLLTGGEPSDEIDRIQYEFMSDRVTFRTCRFRIASARELDSIREELKDMGFSAVGHMASNRTTLLFRDAAFLKLTEGMERNIAMGRVMSLVISILIILLGFIISWLMTFSRRQEFALMRGFGAEKKRVFASFFLEQAILSLAGCLVGCTALIRLYAGGAAQPLAAAAYLIFYLLGTAVSILMIGKTDLMELLTVRE